VGLAACTTGEKIELSPTFNNASREEIVAEMNLVAPLVTPAHLSECRAKLEAQSFLGAKYKVAGEFAPNLRASCIVQNRGAGLQMLHSNAKAVAFMVQMSKISGVYGTGSPTKVAGCRFILVDGQVRFGGLVPERVSSLDVCRYVSSVERPADPPQLQRA
jgi:hypothetical protein